MTSMVWMAMGLGAHRLLSLLALGLRLRAQAQQQRERHHYLLKITRVLPEGSYLDERHLDGTWFRLTIDRPRLSGCDHG